MGPCSEVIGSSGLWSYLDVCHFHRIGEREVSLSASENIVCLEAKTRETSLLYFGKVFQCVYSKELGRIS